MPRTVTLVEFSDLLATAQRIGYDWNAAHDFLYKDDVLPWPGESTIEHHLSDIDQYRYSDDTKAVLRAFYEEHGIENFTLTSC